MKNKYYSLLFGLAIGVLLGLNLFLAFQNRNLKNKDRSAYDKVSEFDHYYEMFRRWNAAAIMNNDTKLSPDLKLEDENGFPVSLSQLAEANNGYPKLVIKNSALACSVCLEEELKQIAKYISIIGSDNVVVLASDYNQRSLKTIKQAATLDFQLYQLERLGIPYEDDYYNLFMFILDKDLKVKSFFVPEKTLPELSDNYYSAVCETFFKR